MAAVDTNESRRPTGAPLVERLLSSTSPDRRAATPTEADVINRLHALPDSALFTPAETELYLNVRRDLLRAWRWRGGGPPFVGRAHLIRYRKGDLDAFLAGSDQPEAA
jgi:hypothetical protein